MGFFLNIPWRSSDMETSEMQARAEATRALVRRAAPRNLLTVRREFQGMIDGGQGGLAQSRGLLTYAQNYQGDFSLKYQPVINRPDPYTKGYRR